MADAIKQVVLPDGTPVWARISLAEGAAGNYTQTGFGDAVAAKVEGLNELVKGVAGSLREATRRARPDEVTVEFGIELTGGPGKVFSLLAAGESKAAINVTLTWKGGSLAAPDGATGGSDGA
ncbi:CU044_2847 family protein [Streptomyces sp. NPDC050610]|uniref:CU044_2847 family protein n=1 Tax=Streptomyces sp. NPDC050610 TaxID=3157097 RepID=UPI00342DB0D9